MYGLLLNPILGDRRILRRGLHEEAVIQSNELPVVTFLEPDQVKLKKKKLPFKLYHAGNYLLTPKTNSCPLLVVVLSTKADPNGRSFLPKRWNTDPITKLTSLPMTY